MNYLFKDNHYSNTSLSGNLLSALVRSKPAKVKALSTYSYQKQENIKNCLDSVFLTLTKVEIIFFFILEGINEPSLCSPASMALKAIATECIFELAPYAETILTSCQQALSANNLKVSKHCHKVSVIIY